MWIYILIFIVTAYFALTNFNKQEKVSKKFFYGYSLLLGLFVGMSDMLGGYDRYIYAEVYTMQAEDVHMGMGIFNSDFMHYFDHEPVFGLINTLIGLITPNRYIFILLYSILMYALIPISLYKYTKNPFFSMLLYLSMMFFFSFVYLRQVLACGILWLSLPYVVDRKFWKFAALVAIATMIHNSAIYFLGLYFLPLKKYRFKTIIWVMAILLGLGLTGVTGTIFAIGGDITNDAKIAGYADTANYGFRIEYMLESVFFLYILYRHYKQVKTDDYTLVILNVYLMFCGILLFFVKSSDGGRIAWYCMIGIMILLSDFCSSKYLPLTKYLITIVCVFLYMRILTGWGVRIYPYKTFLTNGFRKDDYIYDLYEYDHTYDYDKLYNLKFN